MTKSRNKAVDMHTATCDKNGFAVVQIFYKDDGLVQSHTITEVNHDGDDEEETVAVVVRFSFGGCFRQWVTHNTFSGFLE